MNTNDEQNDIEDTDIDSEVVASDEEGNALSDSSPAAIKKLREKLAKAVEEKQEYLNNWQRDKAEFINIRKRDEESKMEFLKFAEQKVLEDIIPTIDALEVAISHASALNEAGEAAKAFKKGIEGVYQNFINTLAKRDVVSFGSVGDVFDHNLHHSIAVTETVDTAQDGHVSEILQKGYKMQNKVIRPALVKVFETK